MIRWDELSGVHDALRIDRLLDRTQGRKPHRIDRPAEIGELELPDAMFGRQRSARLADEIVHEGRHARPFLGQPSLVVETDGWTDIEVDVAVAEMTERQHARAGKLSLDRLGAFVEETRHGGYRNRHIMLGGAAIKALRLRNILPQF